jgi:cytosine deaminase
VIDIRGDLVSPPFVDPHFHMDATLSYGQPRINASGTLLEGIALWGELKPLLTHEAVIERALAYCDWAVPWGCSRSVPMSMSATTGCWRRGACSRCATGRGLHRPAARRLSAGRALPVAERAREHHPRARLGVDVVGGIPHFERTMADGRASVTRALRDRRRARADGRHALRRDRRSDVAAYRATGLRDAAARPAGPVAGSHLTSMHSMDNYYVSKLLPLIAEAEVAAIPNPLINITLQGVTTPIRSGAA